MMLVKHIHLATHIKGEQRFAWWYTEETKASLLRHLGLFASSNMTPFSFRDAAIVSKKVRNDEYPVWGVTTIGERPNG